MAVKTTRITLETETLVTVHHAKAASAWCPDCRMDVDVIVLDHDSLAEPTTTAEIQEWLGKGKLHLWQAPSGTHPDLRAIPFAMLRAGGSSKTLPFH